MTSTDQVELQIRIAARPATVFRYFTDPARFQQWMGPRSEFDARAGGALIVRFPTDDPSAMGSITEVVPDRRIVFTWGYDGSNHGMAPGSSTVSVDLEVIPEGTLLTLRHWGFPRPELGQEHLGGWRHYFGVVAAKAAEETVGVVAEHVVDQFIAAWRESDAARRGALLAECFEPDGLYRDAYGYVPGIAGLSTFIANAQKFMPGLTLARTGAVRHAHGSICYQWTMTGADGKVVSNGISAGECSPEGRIRSLTGFWG
jgi:uncharacterized protein YndB with AHSA1/START domain